MLRSNADTLRRAECLLAETRAALADHGETIIATEPPPGYPIPGV